MSTTVNHAWLLELCDHYMYYALVLLLCMHIRQLLCNLRCTRHIYEELL